MAATDDTTGLPVEGADATQAFLQGQAGVAPDADGRVRVMRNGVLGSVDAGELEGFLRATPGARLATQDELRARQLQRDYGEGVGNELRAGAEGFARSITLGLSDVAAGAIGGDETRLGMQARRELAAGGLAATVGAGLGVVATGLAGAAKGGLAAALSASPAGLAMRAGQAVGGLAGAAAGAATKAGAAAAAGALEGALFGAGEGVSDWALNPVAQERTAERLMASMRERAGPGALLGGLTAGAGSLAASAVGAGARKTRELFRRMAKGEDAAEAAAGLKLSASGRAATTADDTLTVELEAGQRMPDSPLQQLAQGATARQRFADMQQAATTQVSKDISEVSRTADELFGRSAGVNLKPGRMRELFAKDPPLDATHTTGAVVDTLQGMDDALARMRSQADVYEKRALKGFEDVREDIAQIASGITPKNRTGMLATPDELEAAFVGLDRLKRRLGTVRKSVGQVDQGAAAALNDQYETLRRVLEDADVWGGSASSLQKTNNAAISSYLDYAGAFENGFALARGSQTTRSAFDPFERVAEADPAKVGSMLTSIGKAENAHAEDVLLTGVKRRVEMLDTLREQYALDGEAAAKVAAAKKAAERVEKTVRELHGVRVQGDKFDATIQALSDIPLIGGNLAKVKVSTGRALALAMDQQADATAAMASSRVGAMQRIWMASHGIGQRIAEATARYARVGAAAARRAAPALPASAGGEYTAQSRRQRFEASYAAVRDFERDPQAALRRALRTQAGLGTVAPVLAGAYAAKTTAAASFLASKLPRPPFRANVLAHEDDGAPPDISPTEQRHYLEYADAVEQPTVILDQLERGRVSPRTVEAVRTVYPRLYEDVRNGVLQELQASEREPDYHDRLSLGVLFDLPTDPALEPSMLAALQQSAAQGGPVTPEGQQAMLAPSKRTAPDVAGLHETRSQAAQQP